MGLRYRGFSGEEAACISLATRPSCCADLSGAGDERRGLGTFRSRDALFAGAGGLGAVVYILGLALLRVEELATAQRRTEEGLEQLTARVSVLAGAMQRMADDLGRLKGWSLEERARRKAHALFRRLIRRPRLVAEEQFAQLVDDAQDQGTLSPEEADRLIEADVVVRGQEPDDRSEVYLIAEVSWGIGVKDVQRARERAALARRIGLPAQPVVVGTWVTPEAERLIQHDGTLVLLIRPDDWTP